MRIFYFLFIVAGFWVSALHSSLCSAESSVLTELFEYELPVTFEFNSQYPEMSTHTACKVASLTVDGLRYYRTVLSWPNIKNPILASGNVNRGPFTPESFYYEDELPLFIGNAVVKVKYRTAYELGPKTLEVRRSEVIATDSSGEDLYRYVCGKSNLIN